MVPQKSVQMSAVFPSPTHHSNRPVGSFFVAADGRILSHNESALALWGRWPHAGQAFYQTMFRLFSRQGRELKTEENPVARALRGLPTAEPESLIAERPDGTRAVWKVRAEPQLEASSIKGAIVTFSLADLGPSVRLPEEALPTLIGYLGNDLRFRFANAAFESWFGLGEGQVIGKSFETVIGAAAYAEVAPEVRLALDGATQDFERFVPMGAGGSRFLLLRLIPDAAPGGYVRGMALIGSDISAERRAELEREAAAKLARDLASRASAEGQGRHLKLG